MAKNEVYVNVEGHPDNPLLDVALEKGAAVDDDGRQYKRVENFEVEAATAEPRDGTFILYLGIPSPGKPPVNWREVARFDRRKVGNQTFWEYRPIRTEMSAQTLAGLEELHGRDTFSDHILGRPSHELKKATIEGAVLIKQNTGSQNLKVRYNGIWFGAGLFRKYQQLPRPRTRAERGFNYPETTIA